MAERKFQLCGLRDHHRPQRHHHRQAAVQPPLHRRGERRRQPVGAGQESAGGIPRPELPVQRAAGRAEDGRRHLPPAGDRLEPSGQEVRDQQPDHSHRLPGTVCRLRAAVPGRDQHGALRTDCPARPGGELRPRRHRRALYAGGHRGSVAGDTGGTPAHPAHRQQQLLRAGLRRNGHRQRAGGVLHPQRQLPQG